MEKAGVTLQNAIHHVVLKSNPSHVTLQLHQLHLFPQRALTLQ